MTLEAKCHVNFIDGDFFSAMPGVKLHLTSKLLAYDIGNVQIGQNAIEIPANTSDYVISGKCPSSCTGVFLPSTIYITDIYLHMHGLGKCIRLFVIVSSFFSLY